MTARRRYLPPNAVRRIGIELNQGRVHGWLENMSDLLDTPVPTIKCWSVPSTSRAARPIPGAAANLLLLLVALKRNRVSMDGLRKRLEAEATRWLDEPEEME